MRGACTRARRRWHSSSSPLRGPRDWPLGGMICRESDYINRVGARAYRKAERGGYVQEKGAGYMAGGRGQSGWAKG